MPFGIQPSFAGGELSPSISARIDISKYHVGLATCLNMVVQAEGGVHNRQGTRYIWPAYRSGYPSRLVPFSYSTIQNYVLEFAESVIRVFKDRGIVLYDDGPSVGEPVEIVTTYTQDQLWEIKFAQSADVLTLVHPEHPVRELKRMGDDDWLLEDVVFGPEIDPPTNVQVTGEGSGSTTYNYVVTSFSEDGIEESSRSNVGTVTGKPDAGWKNTVTWTAEADAEYYHIYRDKNGIYGFVGRAEGTSFVDDNIDPDTSKTAPKFRDPFDSVNNYPGAVTYHKQRRGFGGTILDPQTSWFTKTANFYNFNRSTPTQDDDAIQLSLVGGTPTNQVNAIEHYVSFTDLLVFTTGAVWTLSSGNDPFGPNTVTTNPQSYRGSTSIRPLVIEDTVLYMQTGDIVRDLGYKFESDSYNGNNLGVLSKHMFEDYTFIDWTYAPAPDSIIWLVRDDGVMLGLTYLKEHQVWGWHRHTTEGKFKSVTSVLDGEQDVVYVCVERTINGQTVHYIEHVGLHFNPYGRQDVSEAFFVDSGLTYDGPPATVFSGLDHLEGEAVYALADGNVYDDLVVENGQVTLDVPASLVHIGLPILAEMETMNVDFSTEEGTVQGRVKTIPRVALRVLNSRGFWVGPSRDQMVEAKWRTTEGYNEATKVFSGDIHVPLPADYNNNGRLVVQQRDPLPLHALAVIPEIESGN